MRLLSRSFAPSSVSAWISTQSAVCPWLEWLVTAYPPCLACDGHRKSLADLLFSVLPAVTGPLFHG